ncbi:uncharacterized protein [Parasteatoda tepidariorum]|uniref:uncharacterized protein n=1 Tax=Parasteatoda tepidariorum TaxID=114398 RepID=UPI001C720FFB|nr:uncharacterized protein LOC122268290 [Parasteatoda tepidariorum]
MNNEDSVCSALDNNTVLQPGEHLVKNSNTRQGLGAYSSQQDEEIDALHEGKEGGTGQNSMTMSYGEITLDQELRNCRKSSKSPESETADEHLEKIKQYGFDSAFQQMSDSIEHDAASECEDKIIREDSEREDIDEDVMSGSYGEISLDRELLSSNKNSDSPSSKEDLKMDENKLTEDTVKEKRRPDSLVLTQNPLSHNEYVGTSREEGVQQMHKSQQTSECRTSAEVSPSLSSEEYALHSMGHARSGSDTSGLSELQGTLTVDGDLVTFVAEDLQEKIKMSSPVSRVTDTSSFPGSRSSTPSLYRQALQPQFHIVDPHVISDLEAQAKKVATVIDTMLENLSETLQSFSSLTLACMETYESSVCKTCDAVDANIKSVYQLMAKCEELSNSMQPLYKVSAEVKHIKKMLEQLEHIVEHKS